MAGTKRCSRCQKPQPVEMFSKKRATADGLASRCKPCMAHIQRLIRYGLSEEDWKTLLEKQSGVCAICGRPDRQYAHLSVDHDHETGEVRGLLCSDCNPMLGYARNDIQVLLNAARYLEGFQN